MERRRRESEEWTGERVGVISDLTRGNRRCKRTTHGPQDLLELWVV